MKLYSYWRSTTSYRVRIALNLKAIDYRIVPVDLLANGQQEKDFVELNPSASLPVLVLDDGAILSQSLSIIEYLDRVYPNPPLIPQNPCQRSKTMEIAYSVAMDIHPVNNLRIVNHLKNRFGADAEQIKAWMQHWMSAGFSAIEPKLTANGPYALGTELSLADLCIVSQLYNARRWEVDLTPFPRIQRTEIACLKNRAIVSAHPDNQPDSNKK